jgi:hypothetical protein
MCMMFLINREEMIKQAMIINKQSPLDTLIVNSKGTIVFEPKKKDTILEKICYLSLVAKFNPSV